MQTKHQLNGIFITEDGENFLCIRQLYVNGLRTGNLLDGKIYQGRNFKLVKEEINHGSEDQSKDIRSQC
jgi:hypothetical protein